MSCFAPELRSTCFVEIRSKRVEIIVDFVFFLCEKCAKILLFLNYVKLIIETKESTNIAVPFIRVEINLRHEFWFINFENSFLKCVLLCLSTSVQTCSKFRV